MDSVWLQFFFNFYWKWLFCTQSENVCSCWIFEYKHSQYECKLHEYFSLSILNHYPCIWNLTSTLKFL